MADLQYDNLPVGMRLHGSGDYYEIGVTVADVFLPFGIAKAGGFEDDLAEAKANAPHDDGAPATAPQPTQ